MLDCSIDLILSHSVIEIVDEGPASLHPGVLLRSLSFMAINPLIRPRRYSSTKDYLITWWTGQVLPVLTLPCVIVRKVILPVPTSWEPCPPIIGTGLLWGDLDEVVKLIVGGVYLVVHYR